MMKCSEIQESLSQFIEGDLSEVANSDVKKHLSSCDACQRELDEMTSFLSAFDNKEMEVPSSNLKANFDKMLAQEIENNKPRW